MLDQQADLEEVLPGDERRSEINAWETTIAPGDAPEWIANQQAVDAAIDVEDAAAIAIINTPPTTMAGVTAVFGLRGRS